MPKLISYEFKDNTHLTKKQQKTKELPKNVFVTIENYIINLL